MLAASPIGQAYNSAGDHALSRGVGNPLFSIGILPTNKEEKVF
jgi:hypothetical protein